jgi:glycosyltransferase involved in cell wall biosynthesis
MDLSLVIPVFNEVENLPIFHEAVKLALKGISMSWEVIYVDDGSTDGSVTVLETFAQSDPSHVAIIEFRRNFGQTAAIAAGIDHAHGDIIVLLDADMQNDPADIPTLLAKLEEGYDVVSGWRKSRKDPFLTRTLPSVMANWLISKVTGVHLHDYGCTLKAYRREVLSEFKLYGEMHRFIPVYAYAYGAKITEIPVNHHPRKFGKAKYGLERTIKVVLDLLTVKYILSYSKKPIYLFGGAGILLSIASVFMFCYILIRRTLDGVSMLGSPIFQLSVMLAIMGFQSILMGLIAELLTRTYHEAQAKPTYTVRRLIGLKKAERK